MITIPDLHVGHGAAAGPVTVFPVWADAVLLRGVTTGTAARVDVRELSDGADVQRLSVTNLGSRRPCCWKANYSKVAGRPGRWPATC